MTTALGQRALQQWVRATGRTWWQAGYADGRVLNEWETAKLPGLVLVALGKGGDSSRWEDIPKPGMRSLRLLAPNAAAHVESNRDFTLFQFKLGHVSIGIGHAGSIRDTSAHIIGRVINSDGDCELMVYEFDGQNPGRMVGPVRDNVLDLKYQQIGPLALDVLGVKL